MAGMGPAPKPAHLRQRRNRTATAARLIESSPLTDGVPELPIKLGPRGGVRKWHPMVVDWWHDVWTSPMATEYTQADVHGLVMLADLMEKYWRTGDEKLATEIRLQRQCFGLTPIDRRRLQWEIQRGEEAEMKRPRGPRQDKPAETSDPRQKLRAVK